MEPHDVWSARRRIYAFGGYRTVLEECQDFAGAYYDDIIIHSPDSSTHFQHVDTVLTKLAERGLRENYAKCEFFKPSVKFVGLMVH